MQKNHNTQLYQTWNERWKGSEESEQLTHMGRIMFGAKKKALKDLIKYLSIESVIEVGCGLGHTMSVYEALNLDCIGIDVSSHAVANCKSKGLNAILQKIEDVSVSYDLVSSDGMLEHFLNFEPYARHLMRISRRYVILIQPNHVSFFGKTLAYLAELIRSDKNVFEYNYRIKDFISIFQENGFMIIKNQPVFLDVFRLLLFEKGPCRQLS